MKFQKVPITIDAELFLGEENYDEISKFCPTLERTGTEPSTYQLWNSLESSYINVPVGHWIIKGPMGEFYPHEPELFKQNYVPVGKAGVV